MSTKYLETFVIWFCIGISSNKGKCDSKDSYQMEITNAPQDVFFLCVFKKIRNTFILLLLFRASTYATHFLSLLSVKGCEEEWVKRRKHQEHSSKLGIISSKVYLIKGYKCNHRIEQYGNLLCGMISQELLKLRFTFRT